MPRIRVIAFAVWVSVVLLLSGLYVVQPELLEPARVVDVLRGSGQPVL